MHSTGCADERERERETRVKLTIRHKKHGKHSSPIRISRACSGCALDENKKITLPSPPFAFFSSRKSDMENTAVRLKEIRGEVLIVHRSLADFSLLLLWLCLRHRTVNWMAYEKNRLSGFLAMKIWSFFAVLAVLNVICNESLRLWKIYHVWCGEFLTITKVSRAIPELG
jgi:hypothetical protein